MTLHLASPWRAVAVSIALAAACCGPARAEKADRDAQMTIAADSQSTIDLLKQVVVFNGNVVITQGTLAIHADKVELHQTAEGFRSAVALGSASQPARFREKRDGVDEFIEGRADRIEYDGQSDTVHFIGHAQVRRLRGTTPADEINGNRISYDNVAELFSVEGGATNVSQSNPSGRVRAVLTPASSPSRPATNAAATAAVPTPAASAVLRPSDSLGGRE